MMMLIVVGLVAGAFAGFLAGGALGVIYGAKFAKRILEREGRLLPETRPAQAQS